MEIEQDHLRHTEGEGDGWVNWSGLATTLKDFNEGISELLFVVSRLMVMLTRPQDRSFPRIHSD